jgi:hypothetical protein
MEIDMTRYNQVTTSGEGTRPMTDGAADNIGAGEKFSTKRNAAGEEISGGPAPKERMQDKRRDVEAAEHDDSSDFNLHEDLHATPNTEDSQSRPRD